MPVDVILGLQWGDEGKGKIVDVLSPDYDIIARFQGGPNAGHTLEFGGRKFVLHTIPSGIFRESIVNVIGNGVIIDPYILRKEIQQVENAGFEASRSLLVSRRAHLILPSHRLLDAVNEQSKGENKIGSTLKGIGPCYTDKTGRNGLRVGDLFLPDFPQKYQALKSQHLRWVIFNGIDPQTIPIEGMSIDEYEKNWLDSLELLRNLQCIDTEIYLNQALSQGRKILAEGAQGTMLDIDFGSYPFVTSSNTMAGGVCVGLGVSPRHIGKIYGIFKAYCTRVGSGPFPTELLDETGELLRKAGREFGSTTGRPRRCGWLDLPALKYSISINGITDLVMTKADVLNDFAKVGICDNYRFDGKQFDILPFDLADDRLNPEVREMPGWQEPLLRDNLPPAFMVYLQHIEQITGVPVSIVSTGPDRDSTIIMRH